MSNKKIANVGGQALIEGILMRGPKKSAIALRMPNGEIETRDKNFVSLREKNKFCALPIVRGVVGFVESMIIGYKSLIESAEAAGVQEEKNMSKVDKWIEEKFGDRLMGIVGAISSVFGIVLSLVIFMYLPAFLVDVADKYITNNSLSNYHPLFEGILKILIFIGYVALVSQLKDIKRVFMYHGAEHKTIFCYENNQELTVENVKKFKRFHPRCGTSFIFLLMIIGIFISTLLVFIFPVLNDIRWLWVIAKLLVLPLIMGIGYEYIRYAGSHENTVTNIISAPGLWIQRLTTKEPTDDIIEVGIASLKAVIEDDSFCEKEKEKK